MRDGQQGSRGRSRFAREGSHDNSFQGGKQPNALLKRWVYSVAIISCVF